MQNPEDTIPVTDSEPEAPSDQATSKRPWWQKTVPPVVAYIMAGLFFGMTAWLVVLAVMDAGAHFVLLVPSLFSCFALGLIYIIRAPRKTPTTWNDLIAILALAVPAIAYPVIFNNKIRQEFSDEADIELVVTIVIAAIAGMLAVVSASRVGSVQISPGDPAPTKEPRHHTSGIIILPLTWAVGATLAIIIVTAALAFLVGSSHG